MNTHTQRKRKGQNKEPKLLKNVGERPIRSRKVSNQQGPKGQAEEIRTRAKVA